MSREIDDPGPDAGSRAMTEADHDWVRTLLAATPLPDPGPERTARWRAVVDEAVDAARAEAEAHRRLRPAPPAARGLRTRLPGRRPPGAGRAAPRDRRPSRFSGVSLAAAAVVVALALPAGSAVEGADPEGTAPLVLSRAELPALAGRAFGGALDGGLDATRCLTALGVTERPLGGRSVVLDGRPGALLVLPTGRAGRLRLLVVAPACGADGPAEVLADQLVGP